jgi:hypothetical protein
MLHLTVKPAGRSHKVTAAILTVDPDRRLGAADNCTDYAVMRTQNIEF